MIYQDIDINMIPGQVMPIVNVSQYDENSRTIRIALHDGASDYTIPTNGAVEVVGYKPDRTAFGVSCTQVDSHTVSFELLEEMANVKGDAICEVRIYDEDETSFIGSGNFIICVEPSPIDYASLVSETNLPYRVLYNSGSASYSHPSAIMSYIQFANVDLPKGKWLLIVRAKFSTNANGNRGLAVAFSSSGSDYANVVPSCAGMPTRMEVTQLMQVSASTETIYFTAGYNVAADINVEYEWTAIELI